MKIVPYGSNHAVNRVSINKADAVPGYKRGFDQHFPTISSVDYAGREGLISSFGDFVVGNKLADISVVFNYEVNTERLVSTQSGTGAASVDASRLKISAISGVGGQTIETIGPIPYRPGHNAFALFTYAFDTYKTGITQEIGVGDDNDGYVLTVGSDGKLAVIHRNGGVEVVTGADDFAFDPLDGSGVSGFILDPSKMNIYRIEYGYLGILPPFLEVYGGALRGWIPFHTIDITNQVNTLVISDPYLGIRAKVTSDGTNDVTNYSGSWLGGTIGVERTHLANDQFSFAYTKALGSAGTFAVFSLKVLDTYKTKTNKIPVDLHLFSVGVEGNKPHIAYIYKNTTLTSPSWNDIDANNSVMQYDIAGTLPGAPDGKMMRALPLGKADSGERLMEPGEVRVNAGDVLTFVVETTSSTSDIVASAHWDELK
jgi:hypothetical protein